MSHPLESPWWSGCGGRWRSRISGSRRLLRNPKRRGTSSTRWWVNSGVASTVALRRGTWESPRCIAEGRPMERSRRSNVNIETIYRLGSGVIDSLLYVGYAKSEDNPYEPPNPSDSGDCPHHPQEPLPGAHTHDRPRTV